jgi:hypothetical protein
MLQAADPFIDHLQLQLHVLAMDLECLDLVLE